VGDLIRRLMIIYREPSFHASHYRVYILPASLYNTIDTKADIGFNRVPARSCKKYCSKESLLAKPNFDFQKRQKEIAKKKKNEEKKQRQLEKNTSTSAENPVQAPEEGDAR